MVIYFLFLTFFLLGLYEKVKGRILLLTCLTCSTFNKGVLKNKKGEEAPNYPFPPQTKPNQKKPRQMKKACLSSELSTDSSWPGTEKAGLGT